jgi:hypothetical protein
MTYAELGIPSTRELRRCGVASPDIDWKSVASASMQVLADVRAEVERLRFKNEQLVGAGKSLVRALRFSSEWGDAVADLEDLVGETK